jgi:hypothetical protein
MFKRALIAATISLAAVSAQANDVLLTENFDDITTLAGSGWTMANSSFPIDPVDGTNWYQGDTGNFAAQSGADNSYIAANYHNAAPGGFILNTLASPTFSTEVAGTISFWARAFIYDGYSDTLNFAFLGSTLGSFSSQVVTLTGEWTEYTISYAAQGAGSVGRLMFNYFGAADTSNYIGIDTVSVTAVPEPSTWLLMGLGLAGVVAVRRRTAVKA